MLISLLFSDTFSADENWLARSDSKALNLTCTYLSNYTYILRIPVIQPSPGRGNVRQKFDETCCKRTGKLGFPSSVDVILVLYVLYH